MKKLIYIGAIAAICCVGCKKKDKDAQEAYPTTVTVGTVEEDSVMIYKDYPGTLKAKDMVSIVGKVNGQLKSINFTGGDIVRKGALLFIIDETQYRNAVNQAQGQLQNAISSTEYYTKQYAAMQKAYAADAVSEMELLQAKSNLEEGKAQIKSYQAALETAKTNLSYCRVTAPLTGRITKSNLSVGNYIDGGASPVELATMYDNTLFFAEFYIEDATYIHLTGNSGKTLAGAMDSIPLTFSDALDHTYKGKMEYMAPDIDQSTGTMLLRIKIDNKYDELRDGMYVTISLPYRNEPKALLIDDASIGTDQRGKYVYIVGNDGVVKYTPVKVGALVGTKRVIEEGVQPGQKYVDKALLKVRNGMKVKVAEQQPNQPASK